MARPQVKINPVADQYADRRTERIVEFSSGEPGGPGGLITFKRADDGSLVVDLSRLDEGVTVRVSSDRLPR